MDKRYEVYALADRHFYDPPDRLSAGAHEGTPLYEAARREVPAGWDAARIGDWLTLTPLGADGTPESGPSQGWKVHASATRVNAERIAAIVPHAGLAADGADAVARLEREKEALERTAGTGVVPEVRDWFTLGDHRFLVMDFLEGRPLNSFFAERHPLLTPDPDPKAVAEYTAWAQRIHAAVERAVAAVHGRGIVFNDLHVFNIMVAPDEKTVSLLDFEAAAPVTEQGRQVVAHPGFFAPPDRTGIDVDRDGRGARPLRRGLSAGPRGAGAGDGGDGRAAPGVRGALGAGGTERAHPGRRGGTAAAAGVGRR